MALYNFTANYLHVDLDHHNYVVFVKYKKHCHLPFFLCVRFVIPFTFFSAETHRCNLIRLIYSVDFHN